MRFMRRVSAAVQLMGARIGVALLGVTLLGAACGSDDPVRSPEPAVDVVASTALIADWVSQVGGERVRVRSLVESGADVHTWQPEPSEVIAIAEADVVLLSGGGLEAGFASLVRRNVGGSLIVLADAIDLEGFAPGLAEAREDDVRDPHFWLDAERAIVAIKRVRDVLIGLDPAGTAGYRDRTAAYLGEVRAVDAEVGALLAALPRERRVLVTFHDAYGYFARRYGLTILGFVVEGPEEEPSAADMAALVEGMEAAGARVIYREPQFSARVVQRVADDAGAEVRPIYSQLGGGVDSYLALLRANAASISE